MLYISYLLYIMMSYVMSYQYTMSILLSAYTMNYEYTLMIQWLWNWNAHL